MPTVKERPEILEAGVEARFDSDETSRALGKPIFDLTPTWDKGLGRTGGRSSTVGPAAIDIGIAAN